jgi:hypothetical protein
MSSARKHDWADETAELSGDNLLWKQYVVYVDLFRFYVDVTWRIVAWYYAVTGVVLVYYFDHLGENRYLEYSLVFIAVMSLGFGAVCWHARSQVADLRERLDYIVGRLRLPGRPHVEFLSDLLALCGLACAVIAVGLVAAVAVLPR